MISNLSGSTTEPMINYEISTDSHHYRPHLAISTLFLFSARLINLISKDTNMVFSIYWIRKLVRTWSVGVEASTSCVNGEHPIGYSLGQALRRVITFAQAQFYSGMISYHVIIPVATCRWNWQQMHDKYDTRARDFFCVLQGPFMGPCPNAKYPDFFPIW